METLELGEFTATCYAKLYTIIGDQTARTYYLTAIAKASTTFDVMEVVYNDTPTHLDPNDEHAVSYFCADMNEVNDYIMGLEGIE